MRLGGEADVAQAAVVGIGRARGEPAFEQGQDPAVGGGGGHRRLGAERRDGDAPPLLLGDEQQQQQVPGRIGKQRLPEDPLPLPPLRDPLPRQRPLEREAAGGAMLHGRAGMPALDQARLTVFEIIVDRLDLVGTEGVDKSEIVGDVLIEEHRGALPIKIVEV